MQRGDLFSTMMAVHHDLESQFFAHQTALLDRDYPRAALALSDYRRELFAHAADEERLVLPRYKDLGGDDTDAPVRLFTGEHDKMRAFVDEFVRRVEELRQNRTTRDFSNSSTAKPRSRTSCSTTTCANATCCIRIWRIASRPRSSRPCSPRAACADEDRAQRLPSRRPVTIQGERPRSSTPRLFTVMRSEGSPLRARNVRK